MTGEPLTFGCDRNFTAFWTCSSRNGCEFTKTDVVELGLTGSSPAFCWSTFVGCTISAPTPQKRESEINFIITKTIELTTYLKHSASKYNQSSMETFMIQQHTVQ